MIKKNAFRPSILSLKIVQYLFINKKGVTIKDLANNIKTDYKNVHDAVTALFEDGIINKEKIGNYNICKLNYSNEDIIEYLKEYNFYIKVRQFRKEHPTEYRIIMETCEKLKYKIEPFFICLVFGSYARREEKNGSDIDLLFLTSFSRADTLIRKVLNNINAPYQSKFHITEQNIMNFIKDLKNKDKVSIANELFKSFPILFYGDDIFFKIMVEANQ